MLIYDGDCGFCTTSAMWIARRLPESCDVVPWQSLDLDVYGLEERDVTTAAYWIDDAGVPQRGHLAIAGALGAAGQPWNVIGRLIGAPPLVWLASPVYGLVAKYRHNLPGSTDACRIPPGTG